MQQYPGVYLQSQIIKHVMSQRSVPMLAWGEVEIYSSTLDLEGGGRRPPSLSPLSPLGKSQQTLYWRMDGPMTVVKKRK
jgi:hypothetical protein